MLPPPVVPGPTGHVTSLLGPLSPDWEACGPAHFWGDVTEDDQPFLITPDTLPGTGGQLM